MLRSDLFERWLLFFAYGHKFGTARGKFTPLGEIEEARHNARNFLETTFGTPGIFINTRQRLQEPLRIRMIRLSKELFYRRLFHHLASIHDHHLARYLSNDAKIVGDHDNGCA